ncbi:MAG: hypothetical protein WCW17_01430 [Patescibacteria group bacterium]|jgi:hypothetical protein
MFKNKLKYRALMMLILLLANFAFIFTNPPKAYAADYWKFEKKSTNDFKLTRLDGVEEPACLSETDTYTWTGARSTAFTGYMVNVWKSDQITTCYATTDEDNLIINQTYNSASKGGNWAALASAQSIKDGTDFSDHSKNDDTYYEFEIALPADGFKAQIRMPNNGPILAEGTLKSGEMNLKLIHDSLGTDTQARIHTDVYTGKTQLFVYTPEKISIDGGKEQYYFFQKDFNQTDYTHMPKIGEHNVYKQTMTLDKTKLIPSDTQHKLADISIIEQIGGNDCGFPGILIGRVMCDVAKAVWSIIAGFAKGTNDRLRNLVV